MAATPKDPLSSEGMLASRVTRRGFIQSLGVSAAAASVASGAKALAESAQPVDETPAGLSMMGPLPISITLTVNGAKVPLKIEPSTTLLEALRLHAGMTGTKEICDRGSCGGCSVLIDGKLMVSCMMLAVDAVGTSIMTVEGLARDGELTTLQEAFIRHDALQCGYCTPGLLVASTWLLSSNPNPTLQQIQGALAGNICRCGTYTNIFNAVLDASGQKPLLDAAAS